MRQAVFVTGEQYGCPALRRIASSKPSWWSDAAGGERGPATQPSLVAVMAKALLGLRHLQALDLVGRHVGCLEQFTKFFLLCRGDGSADIDERCDDKA